MPAHPLAWCAVERSTLRRAFSVTAVKHDRRTAVPQLPLSARSERLVTPERAARERFSRTFAEVLAERYGGSWTVKWRESTQRDSG